MADPATVDRLLALERARGLRPANLTATRLIKRALEYYENRLTRKACRAERRRDPERQNRLAAVDAARARDPSSRVTET